jgi:hypothetical protein
MSEFQFFVNDKPVTLDSKKADALAVVLMPKSADASQLTGVTLGDIDRLALAESVASGKAWLALAESLKGKSLTVESAIVKRADNGVEYNGVKRFHMSDGSNLCLFARNVVTAITANTTNQTIAEMTITWIDKPSKGATVDSNPLEVDSVDFTFAE